MDDLRDQLRTATAIADEAGQLALSYTHRDKRWQEKSSATDLVTEADHAVEALVVDRLAAAFPDDDVVGEEGGAGTVAEGRPGRRRWYVDPIDGTTNYLKGLDAWGVSLGLADADDRLLLGAIAMPATGESFTAARGHGATRNGVPIRAGDADRLDRALITYALPGRGEQLWGGGDVHERIRSLMRQALGTRMQGCSVADLTRVATGQLDAAVCGGMSAWDVAAGLLICEEAGAVVTTPSGEAAHGPVTAFLVSAPGVHDAIRDVLAPARAATTAATA